MSSIHFHPLKVRDVQPDTDEAVIVSFDVPAALKDAFAFKHGQYLTLRSVVGGEDLRRSYSICAGIDDPCLRVGVRRLPGGVFSSWVAHHLKPGDELEVTGPYGVFTLRASSPRRIVFIGGGAGMAPILCLLRSMADAGVAVSGQVASGAMS